MPASTWEPTSETSARPTVPKLFESHAPDKDPLETDLGSAGDLEPHGKDSSIEVQLAIVATALRRPGQRPRRRPRLDGVRRVERGDQSVRGR